MTEEKTDIVEIRAQRFSIDWTYETVHKIDLNKVIGFELHWRADSWHVVVVTKEETHNDNVYAPRHYSYDLDHWVFPGEAIKLFNNPDVVIIKIVNGWNSKKTFQQVVATLIET